MIEENRIGWLPWWKNVVSEIYYSEPSEIALIIEPGSFDYWGTKYPLLGEKFQHTVSKYTEEELQNKIEDLREKEKQKLNFVVKLCNPNISCEKELDEFEARMSELGYEIKANTPRSILLESTSNE